MVRAVPAMPAGMSGIALPDMSESGPPDPLARLGERLDKARARSTETSCETPRSAIVTPNRRSMRAIVMR